MYMANKTLGKYDIHVFSSLNSQNIPGIIAIENYKEIDGMLYVLEETIEGNTLQEYLNEFPYMSDTNPYKRMLGRCIAIIIVLVITVLILMALDKILL